MRIAYMDFASDGGQLSRTDDFVIAVYALVRIESVCFDASVLKEGIHCSSVEAVERMSANSVNSAGV